MSELLFGVGHDAGWAATWDVEDEAPPLGVAGTRNAPKYCGFAKICVNPVSRVSAEAEAPRFLPSCGFLRLGPCSECCPHLRVGGWGWSTPGTQQSLF